MNVQNLYKMTQFILFGEEKNKITVISEKHGFQGYNASHDVIKNGIYIHTVTVSNSRQTGSTPNIDNPMRPIYLKRLV